jgi:hypothetical protein
MLNSLAAVASPHSKTTSLPILGRMVGFPERGLHRVGDWHRHDFLFDPIASYDVVDRVLTDP